MKRTRRAREGERVRASEEPARQLAGDRQGKQHRQDGNNNKDISISTITIYSTCTILRLLVRVHTTTTEHDELLYIYIRISTRAEYREILNFFRGDWSLPGSGPPPKHNKDKFSQKRKRRNRVQSAGN